MIPAPVPKGGMDAFKYSGHHHTHEEIGNECQCILKMILESGNNGGEKEASKYIGKSEGVKRDESKEREE